MRLATAPGFSPVFPSKRVSCHCAYFEAGSVHGAWFAFCSRYINSQPLFLAAFLPKRARRSRPLASSTSSRAAPRLAVAAGQPLTAALVPFGHPAGIEAAIGADLVSKGRTMSAASRSDCIRDLNDEFRSTLQGGQCLFTSGVSGMGIPFATAALAAVRGFTEFTPDNDPYGEHDFGSLVVAEEKLFWKIDYYDLSLEFGSNDPADPAQTKRVLTIMLAEEY